jgi:hypothetical protein
MGSIRGKVIADCDGDGLPDEGESPYEIDIYLDDGMQSHVNEKGMFYFSTVKSGTRIVALDERDLDGFYIPENEYASVFVHVNEAGESYVTFNVCPDLIISKRAAALPKIKLTKTAVVNPEPIPL